MSEIKTYVAEQFNKYVMGIESMDTFDQFQQQLKDMALKQFWPTIRPLTTPSTKLIPFLSAARHCPSRLYSYLLLLRSAML